MKEWKLGKRSGEKKPSKVKRGKKRRESRGSQQIIDTLWVGKRSRSKSELEKKEGSGIRKRGKVESNKEMLIKHLVSINTHSKGKDSLKELTVSCVPYVGVKQLNKEQINHSLKYRMVLNDLIKCCSPDTLCIQAYKTPPGLNYSLHHLLTCVLQLGSERSH